MKKVLFLTFAVALLAGTSCKKEHTCTCVDSDDGYTEIIPLAKSSRKDAKKVCSQHDYKGTNYDTKCKVN